MICVNFLFRLICDCVEVMVLFIIMWVVLVLCSVFSVLLVKMLCMFM